MSIKRQKKEYREKRLISVRRKGVNEETLLIKVKKILFPYKLPRENFVKIYLPLIAILITGILTIFNIYLSYFREKNSVLFYLSEAWFTQKENKGICGDLKFTILNNGDKALNINIQTKTENIPGLSSPINIKSHDYKYMEINDILICHYEDIEIEKKELITKTKAIDNLKKEIKIYKDGKSAPSRPKGFRISFDDKVYFIDFNIELSIITEKIDIHSLLIARLVFDDNNQLISFTYDPSVNKIL